MRRASSSPSWGMTTRTGPKISSRATGESLPIPVTSVGSTKNPLVCPTGRPPPTTMVPPSSCARSTYPRTRSALAGVDERSADRAGVGRVPGRQRGEGRGGRVDGIAEVLSGTTRRVVMAHPCPACTHTVKADSAQAPPSSASSSTTKADLPPSSRNTRLSVPAASAITVRPVAVDPVKVTWSTRSSRTSRDPKAGSDDGRMLTTPARDVGLLGDQPPQHRGAPRCVGRGLEHHGVARRQRRAQLGQVDLVGDVPRGDGGHHAGGFTPDPALRGHPQGLGHTQVGRPLIGLGQIGDPPQRRHRVVELGRTRHEQRRPRLGDGHGAQLLGVRLHGGPELAQAPHPQRQVGGPRRLVEGAPGRAQGPLGVLVRARRPPPRGPPRWRGSPSRTRHPSTPAPGRRRRACAPRRRTPSRRLPAVAASPSRPSRPSSPKTASQRASVIAARGSSTLERAAELHGGPAGPCGPVRRRRPWHRR